eukprot:TRINITY_DN31279_c0_g1_i2.p1 TRINITY_DN31279_c0_g1~~TRINITY_DN31279_c0_g1_i2.p1  ORF type:complete len:213 (-),score=27.74 TRINITY_DN31279_c0_g1_i2:41-679(-)
MLLGTRASSLQHAFLGLVLHGHLAAAGEAGAALYFDGVDDYATAFPSFNVTSDWTLEFWTWPEGSHIHSRCLIGLQTSLRRNLLTLTSTRDGAWHVAYGPSLQAIPYRSWTSYGREARSHSASPHHVAITHEILSATRSRLQLYLNATLHAAWHADLPVMGNAFEKALPMLLGACHATDDDVGSADLDSDDGIAGNPATGLTRCQVLSNNES